MQQHNNKGRHRPGPGRPGPADLGAVFPPSRHKRVWPAVYVIAALRAGGAL